MWFEVLGFRVEGLGLIIGFRVEGVLHFLGFQGFFCLSLVLWGFSGSGPRAFASL